MSSEIVSVIKSLEETRSRNEKDRILRENANVEGLKEFFKASLDIHNTYFIKKIPSIDVEISHSINLIDAIGMLDRLKDRTYTGNSAIEYVASILSNMEESERALLCRVIKKDPDCGVSKETVNKIWKDLIPSYPILLCQAYSRKAVDKLNWEVGVLAQLKSDGARCNIIIDSEGNVSMFSRQGREIKCHTRFDYLGQKHRNVMIDGELLVKSSGGILSRSTGNGIVNKAIKGTISEDEAASLFLMAWDVIPLEDFYKEKCDIKYIDRFNNLSENYVDNDGIFLTPTTIVYSLDSAFKIYSEYREQDLEGVILKDKDAIWENDRSKKQVKVKAEIVSTMKVVGYQEGKDRFEGLMGALICESEDGLVETNVGGGWSMHMRAQIAADHHNKDIKYTMVVDGVDTEFTAHPTGEEVIGRFVDVLHNGLVTSEGSDKMSLYLCRVNTGDFRYDCSSADTLDEIQSKK
jgi:hypothetical protein